MQTGVVFFRYGSAKLVRLATRRMQCAMSREVTFRPVNLFPGREVSESESNIGVLVLFYCLTVQNNKRNTFTTRTTTCLCTSWFPPNMKLRASCSSEAPSATIASILGSILGNTFVNWARSALTFGILSFGQPSSSRVCSLLPQSARKSKGCCTTVPWWLGLGYDRLN